MAPATDDVQSDLVPLDLGDVGKTDQQRSREVAAQMFEDDEPDETPEQTPAPEEPPKPEPEAAPEPAPSDVPGLTKDAKGRYHRPDGTVASKDEVEKAKATAPEEIPKANEPPPAASEPAVDVEPLQWLAYGKPVEIPGAQYKPGHGVFIPDASVPALRQAWARGHERYPQIIKENADLRDSLTKTYTRREAEANAVIEVLGQYFSTEYAFGQFLEAAAQSPGLALREIRTMLKEKQLELGANVHEPPASLVSPPVDEGEVAEALTEELEQAFRSPEFAGKFTPSQQRELVNVVFQRAGAYLTRADADYPQHGIRKGETVVNVHALWNDLRYEAGRTASKPAPATHPTTGTKAPASAPPPPPPSAVGRSRVTAAPKQRDDRKKASIPTRSLSETADWLLSDDD